MDNVYESLTFVNSSGVEMILSDEHISAYWELRGRSGFSAPEIEIITQKYANGVTKVLKKQIQPRTVTINMVVTGRNPVQRDYLFYDMVEKLMDVSGGDQGRLYVKRRDGSVVYLNCVYSSGFKITEEYRNFHRFTLEFYAADPYFYRDMDSVEILLDDGAKLTLRDGIFLGDGHKLGETTGEGHGTIVNNGSDSILPVITAKRINGDFSITNEATGHKILLNSIVTARTDTLIIDTREDSKSIKIRHEDDTWTDAGQYLDWENINLEFEIIPGENLITFSAGVGSYTEGIVIEMSERFLSA